jgi:hypothetical protein
MFVPLLGHFNLIMKFFAFTVIFEAQHGWYGCPHTITIRSLCANPHKRIMHGAILKKLGPTSKLTSWLHKGWKCKINPFPFYMSVTCYSLEKLYYDSQKVFLYSRFLNSNSFISNSAPNLLYQTSCLVVKFCKHCFYIF